MKLFLFFIYSFIFMGACAGARAHTLIVFMRGGGERDEKNSMARGVGLISWFTAFFLSLSLSLSLSVKCVCKKHKAF